MEEEHVYQRETHGFKLRVPLGTHAERKNGKVALQQLDELPRRFYHACMMERYWPRRLGA